MHYISTLDLSIIIGCSFLFGMITNRLLPPTKKWVNKIVNNLRKD